MQQNRSGLIDDPLNFCLAFSENVYKLLGYLTERKVSSKMAKICEICGKKPMFGNNVSHANNTTRRRWNPNLQTIRAVVNGTPKRVTVCTSCMKAGKVTKNVRTKKTA